MKYRNVKLTVVAGLLLLALAFLVGRVETNTLNSFASNDSSTVKQVKEIEGYKTWTKVNPTPHFMPARFSNACNVDLSRTGAVIDGENNPHRGKYITVFVNDVGKKAMLEQKKPNFPEGSVIVKEKLTAVHSTSPELLTVMIKQKKGFNPKNGDWEYMVVDGTGTKVEARGNLENCQGCHVGEGKTDYIFRTYLTAEMSGGLK